MHTGIYAKLKMTTKKWCYEAIPELFPMQNDPGWCVDGWMQYIICIHNLLFIMNSNYYWIIEKDKSLLVAVMCNVAGDWILRLLSQKHTMSKATQLKKETFFTAIKDAISSSDARCSTLPDIYTHIRLYAPEMTASPSWVHSLLPYTHRQKNSIRQKLSSDER